MSKLYFLSITLHLNRTKSNDRWIFDWLFTRGLGLKWSWRNQKSRKQNVAVPDSRQSMYNNILNSLSLQGGTFDSFVFSAKRTMVSKDSGRGGGGEEGGREREKMHNCRRSSFWATVGQKIALCASPVAAKSLFCFPGSFSFMYRSFSSNMKCVMNSDSGFCCSVILMFLLVHTHGHNSFSEF